MVKTISPEKFKKLVNSPNKFALQCANHMLSLKTLNTIDKSKDFIGYMLALNVYYWYVYSTIHKNESPINRQIKLQLGGYELTDLKGKKVRLDDIDYDDREYRSGFVFQLLDAIGEYLIPLYGMYNEKESKHK